MSNNPPQWPDGWTWEKIKPGHYRTQDHEIRRLRYHYWAVTNPAGQRLALTQTLGEGIEVIVRALRP